MKKKAFLLAPAVAIGLTAMAGAPAMAADHGADGSYATTFQDINQTGASGGAWIEVMNGTAEVKIEAAGLAETFNDAPFPHVQHIHSAADAAGECPTLPANDDNGDGIVDTVEGLPSYGEIVTTFSTSGDTSPAAATDVTVAPSGSSYNYERSIELSDAAQEGLASGQAVVVVHGIDPAGLSEEAASAPSNLVPELPLAATAPALCGVLEMQPAGGADTGVTTAAGISNAGNGGNQIGMIALGGGLLAAAGSAYAVRRSMKAGR